MKNLIKEIFNSQETEILIVNQFESRLNDLAKNGVFNLFEHDEIVKGLTETQEIALKMALIDLLIDNGTQALLTGFKDGFNTSQELNGAECLI